MKTNLIALALLATPAAAQQDHARLDAYAMRDIVARIEAQIHGCMVAPAFEAPRVKPKLRLTFNRDGSLAAKPVLLNRSAHRNFEALAVSGMFAAQNCGAFRIPDIHAPAYGDWRTVIVQINPG